MKNATYRFWAGTSLVPKNISWKLGMADRIIQWRIVLRALHDSSIEQMYILDDERRLKIMIRDEESGPGWTCERCEGEGGLLCSIVDNYIRQS